MRLLVGSIRPGRSSASGESGSLSRASPDWKNSPGEAALAAFPPAIVIAVKALACELPREVGVPLSRFSLPELQRQIIRQGIVASIGRSTLWEWLSNDAIRPWQHRCWIFPRDPDFQRKASRILDLYEGVWEGAPLSDGDCIISADEKTSIQARRRIHPVRGPAPARAMRVEHEYQRMGAWAYLAAWDVRRARVFGRCERRTGIIPFQRLVDQVMTREPYRSAPRVFWILDNGSSHRGEASAARLKERWPNLIVVHTPVHASWLNQVEIYFSVVERKALTPNDFGSLDELRTRLHQFERHYQLVAKPFRWRFTRFDLAKLLDRSRRQESYEVEKVA